MKGLIRGFRPGAQWRYRLGLVVTILSTVSCAPAPDRAAHTVEEYARDLDLRRIEIRKCANDPGTLQAAPDCINAREAERRVSIGSLRDLAPLKLPDKK